MKQIKLHKLNIYNVKYDVLIGRKLDESSSSGIAPQKSELKRQEYMQQAKEYTCTVHLRTITPYLQLNLLHGYIYEIASRSVTYCK